MAAPGRRVFNVDDVLREIFEDSDIGSESDSGSDSEDNIYDNNIDNLDFVREIPMEQSPRNQIDPNDTSSGWSLNDSDIVVMPFWGQSGLTCGIPDNPSPYDMFKLLFDDDMWETLATETNRYAEQQLRTVQLSPHCRMQKWSPVSVDEMKVFFSLIIAMGLTRKSDIDAYWSKQETILTPFFGSRMTKDRFHLILSNLHVTDNESAPARGEPGYDPLYKLRPFMTMTTNNFTKYTPEEELSFDEGLCPFKGRIHFRVYNPMKPNKFGMKFFQVCEASSGYCVGYDIYHGTTDCIQYTDALEEGGGNTYLGLTVTSKIVLGLLAQCGLLSKGHKIYIDNYYTSPELFTELELLHTYACGTVRLNRRDVPKAFGVLKKLKQGECIFRRKGNLLAVKFHDKRDVHMLSTFHPAVIGVTDKTDFRTGDPIMKPRCIIDYVKNMGGVDLSDQIVQYYDILRKSLKWWKKVFLHIFNLLLVNAFLLYKKYGRNVRRKSHMDFRVEIIKALVDSAPNAPKPKTSGRRTMENLDRLTGRHFPQHIKPTEGAKRKHPMRDCIVCNVQKSKRVGMKRKQTTFECQQCERPMCMPECFQRYHTLRDYYLNDADDNE